MTERKHFDTPEEWVQDGACLPPCVFGRYIVRYIDGSRDEGWQFVVMFMQNGFPQAHGYGRSWVEAERRVLELINWRVDEVMEDGEVVAQTGD